MLIFIAMLSFYVFTVHSGYVHDSAINLKRIIYNYSTKLSFFTCNQNSGISFLFFTMANVLEEKFQLIALVLFSLNWSFILESTGEMLTYSVIIWQIAPEWNYDVLMSIWTINIWHSSVYDRILSIWSSWKLL